MKKALICGINGKMGENLVSLLDGDSEMRAVCGVDLHTQSGLTPIYASFNDVKEDIDVIIDFSSPAVLKGELEYAVKHNCPVVHKLNQKVYSQRKVSRFKNRNLFRRFFNQFQIAFAVTRGSKNNGAIMLNGIFELAL